MILILAVMLAMNDPSGNDISVRVPTPIPLPLPVPIVDAPPAPPANPCEAAERQTGASPEMLAWKSARTSNRLVEFRTFLRRYPKSACAVPAKAIVTERERAEAGFKARRTTDATPAIISGDPAFGITSDDYPVTAMRNREEGVVAIAYEIAPDGRIEACQVTQTSGSSALDDATCRISTERARYSPAHTASGKPMRSRGTRRIRWQIPKNEPLEESE